MIDEEIDAIRQRLCKAMVLKNIGLFPTSAYISDVKALLSAYDRTEKKYIATADEKNRLFFELGAERKKIELLNAELVTVRADRDVWKGIVESKVQEAE